MHATGVRRRQEILPGSPLLTETDVDATNGVDLVKCERSHSGLTSWHAHSTNPRQAKNNPSTTPSSKCRSGSAATRQRSAACSNSSTVNAPTIARSLLARLTRRPGDTSVSGQGSPSAPSQPRMRLRMPRREFRSGRGVSSLMGSTTVYEEKVSDSFMALASMAVLNSATAKRWRTVRVPNRDRQLSITGGSEDPHAPPAIKADGLPAGTG